MKSEIEISLYGSGFNRINPIGAQISYGINMIPVALVDLDANHLPLLCDFEGRRRKPITLEVKTTNGCLRFDGLIDGLSFFQTSGNLRAQLVIKSEFQWLMESYPRLPGMHPSSVDVFRRVDVLQYNMDNGSNHVREIDLQQMGLEIGVDVTIIKFFVQVMKKTLETAARYDIASIRAQDLQELIRVSAEYAKTYLPRALNLLDRIDTTATDEMPITAADSKVSAQVMSDVLEASGSLLEAYMLSLANYGCAVVIANNKAFIVPESGFLKVPHGNVPVGAVSSTPNIIYPSQYRSFNFSDGGYKDFKAVYVVSDEQVQITGTSLNAELGHYVDPTAQGGLLCISMPRFMALGMDYQVLRNNKHFHKQIKDHVSTVNSFFSSAEEVEQLRKENRAFTLAHEQEIRTKFISNWAQMKYCQAKYNDRQGSIDAYFNPKWAPGSVGTLYTRNPGTFIDFFVTAVTHSFSVAAPSSGDATTSISFSCGRVGRHTGTGMDKIELYNYDYNKAQTFAKNFVDNITI